MTTASDVVLIEHIVDNINKAIEGEWQDLCISALITALEHQFCQLREDNMDEEDVRERVIDILKNKRMKVETVKPS